MCHEFFTRLWFMCIGPIRSELVKTQSIAAYTKLCHMNQVIHHNLNHMTTSGPKLPN